MDQQYKQMKLGSTIQANEAWLIQESITFYFNHSKNMFKQIGK